MTPVLEIPNAERVVADYLRTQTDSRVVARTPEKNTDDGWVRLTMLAAQDAPSGIEHLILYLIQLDCYAGNDGGVPEAMSSALAIRAAVKNMREQAFDDVVVTDVRFSGMARIPDQDFTPNRERVVLTTQVWMHHGAVSA